ncbi:MAG TPA: ABC transporter permease [Solirubrobacteraceae bacterium]|jgi:peptide/nickel transport system permease protein
MSAFRGAPVALRPGAGVLRRSETLEVLGRACRLRRTQLGLALFGLIAAIAIFGPLLAPKSSTAFVAIPYSPPSGAAPFGTDALGRDVLSRFLAGGHTLLLDSLLAAIVGVGGGALVGLAAAYGRGALDTVLMRISDVLLAFPQIVLVLLAVSTVGPKASLIILMVGLSHLPRTARVIRGAALEVVERDFVKAAEACGERRWRILTADLLPNVSGPLLVEAGLRFTYSIALIAAIAFLGFGPQPPSPDWGLMINENRIGITAQPWAVVLPIIAIALLTVGANLATDGIARTVSGIDRGSR